MDKDFLIQLTNNLYRLTLLFPKKEPLRYKMREIADKILEKYLKSDKCSSPGDEHQLIVLDLEVLDGFFEVAKNQNWVSIIDILRVQEEYNRIKAEIKKITKHPPEEGQTSAKPPEARPREIANSWQEKILDYNPPTTRQGKILEFLKENGRAQVWQVKQVFPEVSKRTLRRDFGFLLKQGKIERIGERNETFYQLKR